MSMTIRQCAECRHARPDPELPLFSAWLICGVYGFRCRQAMNCSAFRRSNPENLRREA